MWSTLPRHIACWTCNLIMRYLSIRWSNLETGHTIITVRISRSFLWYAMNELIHVMQRQIDACNAIMIFGVYRWSFKSFSLIKSWVQNWVSTFALKVSVHFSSSLIFFFYKMLVAVLLEMHASVYFYFWNFHKHIFCHDLCHVILGKTLVYVFFLPLPYDCKHAKI